MWHIPFQVTNPRHLVTCNIPPVGWPGPRSFILVQVKCPGPKALDQSKSDAPLRIDPQLGHLPPYKFCPGTDLDKKICPRSPYRKKHIRLNANEKLLSLIGSDLG